MRHQAIYELYPNVVQIKGNQQPTEQWDKDGNIVIIDENAVSTKEAELEVDEANAKIKKETDSASGKQKLKDLGLSDDEIKALIGV